jgi:MFS family permease
MIASGKKTLIGLNVSVFVMMLGVGMVMPLLPGRLMGFTGSEASVGYIASAFAVSYLLLQVPMGSLADRFGFRTFIIAGYLLCALSGVVYYFSSGASWIFWGRAVQGAGEAPLWALAPALLALKFPASKGRVMGIYNATLHVGLTCGPLLGIIALKLSLNEMAFIFFSIVCLISAVIVRLTVDETREAGAVNPENINLKNLKNLSALISDGRILVTLWGITLYGAGYGLFITAVPAYLRSARGYEQTFVQVFFACFYIAISASQVITGPLSDRFGGKKFMTGGILLAALTFGSFPFLGQNAALTALSICSLGLGSFYLASMTFLNNAVPNSLKGTISGAYFLFWGIGYLAGPVIIGKLGEIYGPAAGFSVFSAALLLEAAALGTLFTIYAKINLT